jgi:hypothetical protein
MSRLTMIAAVLGAAGVVTLAGCAAPVRGRAVAAPAALRTARTPLTGEHALGVAANVDPCSLVDVNSVTGLTNVEPDEPDGLDDCPVQGTDSGGLDVYLDVGPVVTEDAVDIGSAHTVSTLARQLLVDVGDPDSDGYCDAYLVFPDGYVLDVSAYPADPDQGTADVCGAAVDLARNAAEQVLAGGVTHRTFPPGSVGDTDPCGLVGADARHASGLPRLDTLTYPEDHECYWAADDYPQPTLQLRFDVGEEPAATEPTDRTVTIAGRRTLIESTPQGSGDDVCSAQTGLNTYTDATFGPGDGLVEIATLVVDTVPSTPYHACPLVKAVAARVWPKLPAVAH